MKIGFKIAGGGGGKPIFNEFKIANLKKLWTSSFRASQKFHFFTYMGGSVGVAELKQMGAIYLVGQASQLNRALILKNKL